LERNARSNRERCERQMSECVKQLRNIRETLEIKAKSNRKCVRSNKKCVRNNKKRCKEQPREDI
jgi:hypothetical protein